jgi:hypothetical protein
VVTRKVGVAASVLLAAAAGAGGCNAIVGNSDHALGLAGGDATMGGDGEGSEVGPPGSDVGSEVGSSGSDVAAS